MILLGMFGSGGGGGGSYDGFPAVLATATTSDDAVTASHDVNLPAGISSGDLIIIICNWGRPRAADTPSGWTLIDEVGTADGTSFTTTTAFYRVADGSEGSTVAVTTAALTSKMAATAYLIDAGTYGSIEADTDYLNSTGSVDPPSLSPSWGSAKTLWIAAGGSRIGTTVTGYPLADNQLSATMANTGAGDSRPVTAMSCTAESETGTLDPGTFTLSSNSGWTAITIAVSPP